MTEKEKEAVQLNINYIERKDKEKQQKEKRRKIIRFLEFMKIKLIYRNNPRSH